MSDIFLLIQSLLAGAWKVLTSVHFPGTQMTLAVMLIGGAVVGISINVIQKILSARGGGNKDE